MTTDERREVRRIRERDRVRRARYGLEPEDVERMLHEQGGCAVCHTWDSGCQDWAVDHDHACCPYSKRAVPTCGKCVRGILCQKCNMGLGLLQDSAELLKSAIIYLTR